MANTKRGLLRPAAQGCEQSCPMGGGVHAASVGDGAYCPDGEQLWRCSPPPCPLAGAARIAPADIDETIIGRFARHRCRCFGKRRDTHISGKYMKRVHRIVEFLGERGIVRQKATSAGPVLHPRVAQFQDWLRQHRGVTERTIDVHGRMVMRLLATLGNRPQRWDAQLIRRVIIAEAKAVSRPMSRG